ncbi:MAG TPA: FAD-dependent oxidoreductase [Campylobacterales bacterium]|nr:FAD-dependent oxidoreductase [Campylobacterales bacterium]
MLKKVIIVGSGYGGIRAAQTLAKNRDLEVTVVDTRPYHYLQTDIYDYIANKTTITDISVSLVTLFFERETNVTFLQRKIVKVEPSENKLITNFDEELYYDYLVMAIGSRTYFPSFIKGLAEHSHGVKSLKRAFEFKQKFEQAIYKQVESEGVCELNPNFNIVIGGAGLSGVEIAAAMAEYSSRFFAVGGYACGGVAVHLIEASETILPGIDRYLVRKSKKRLEELGVNIITGDKILEVEEGKVHLGSGKTINMNFMIWTGGVEVRKIEGEGFEFNPRGQLKIDEFSRVKGFSNIFAIGDCAEVVNTKGKLLAPTAMVAEFGADVAAYNIAALKHGKELKKIEFGLPGMLVALGGYFTVGVVYGVRLSGLLGFFAKKAVSQMYKWPLTHKCKKALLKSCNK